MPDQPGLPAHWDPPQTPAEALEIALELARDEERWMSGDWISFDPLYERSYYSHSVISAEEPEEAPLGFRFDQYGNLRADDDYVPTCTDVQACSAGLLLIALGNGPKLQEVRREGLDDPAGDLAYSPVGGPAAKFLARGLAEKAAVAGESFPSGGGAYDAVCFITRVNDSDLHGSRREHHAKIVKGFERALELAREAEETAS